MQTVQSVCRSFFRTVTMSSSQARVIDGTLVSKYCFVILRRVTLTPLPGRSVNLSRTRSPPSSNSSLASNPSSLSSRLETVQTPQSMFA